MNVLLFNCGSSSQGFKVYQVESGQAERLIASGKARNVATITNAPQRLDYTIGMEAGTKELELSTHAIAAQQILSLLRENAVPIEAIGHRFVHGGTLFHKTALIDDAAYEKLKACLPLAPIHNPNSFSVIEICRERLPGIPQYAIFDTAFHSGMSEVAKTYALPKAVARKFGYTKYGFHGLSCHDVSNKAAKVMGKPLTELKLVICHLGTGGSSVTAVKDGESFDTSMGYSPLAGLVMSTRTGDIDPEILLELIRSGLSVDEVTEMLNKKSGLIGISGYSSNLNEIIAESDLGNSDCQLAYDVYVRRLKKYIGAFIWLMGGADAVIFTDDVGVKCWQMRERVCSGNEAMGLILDQEKNRGLNDEAITRIDAPGSTIQIWIIPNDEEGVMLKEVIDQLG